MRNAVYVTENWKQYTASLKAQTAMHGVVAPCYQHDNEVPQLHATLSEPLD